MRRMMLSLLLMMIISSSFAQVYSGSSIELTGTSSADRQVKGLAHPENDSSGLRAHSFASGYFFFGNGNGNSVISLQFDPPYDTLKEGMYFNLQFQSTNDSAFKLKIDQLPAFPVYYYNGTVPDSAAIPSGSTISFLYQDSSFLIMNPPAEKCPNGYTRVNERFCIQINENPPASFFNAVTNCANQGAELCGFGEWLNACRNTLTALGMTDNYEWVNTAGNTSNQAKIMGMDSLFGTGCDKSYTTTVTINNSYRCCYALRR